MTDAEKIDNVPAWLRRWFVMHFAIDVIVAVPLFVAPREVLELFGWKTVDPMAARLAAAALFGIGIESLLGRNAGREAFRGMLQLKLIWSAFGTIGLAWSTLEGAVRYAWVGWSTVAIFAGFHVLWWYWFIRLGQSKDSTASKPGARFIV